MTITPFAHQLRFREIARERSRFAFFADPGTGKTIGSLLIIDDIKIKWLVVCPKSIMRSARERDAKHFSGVRTRVIHGDTPAVRRREIYEGEWDLAITTPETFRRHAADFLAAGVRGLILDESSKIKNHESKISRAVIDFADQIDRCYLLSGTPAPNNGTEYWPQLRALSPEAAGRSFWGWVNSRFIPLKRTLYRNGRRIEVTTGYRQAPHQAEKLIEELRSWSWSLKKEDCLDLPEKMDQEIYVELSTDEWQAYDAAETQTTRELTSGEQVNMTKAKNALMKLRQIVGGTVPIEGQRMTLGSSKLDALGELLDELGNEPVIVWCEFTADVDRVADYIRQRGEDVATIDGRTSGKAHETAAAFQAGSLRRIVAHPAAAGHGITLTAASYAIYYSWSFSYEQHQQSRDRIHRAGQTRPCTYYYLVAQIPEAHALRDSDGIPETATVDSAMLRVVRRKATAAEAIRDLLKIDVTEEE
jgi:SNF2 family DNA or RNA helicase